MGGEVPVGATILPAEALILPPEKMFGFGRPKLVLLVILKNSARNSTRVVSVMGVVLNTEKSNSVRPGPSNTPRPTLPQVPDVRRLNAFGSYHWSTVRCFTAPRKV